jgi:putative oxidoreductase
MTRYETDRSHAHSVGLLGGRVLLGGYLAAHGAQKLFGAFNGPGLTATAGGFHHLGLRPGRAMATLAGASELGGGVLTLAGLADPVGPVALVGTMAVASTVHRTAGPFSTTGGYELPLTNLGAALVLAASGPGRYSLDALVGRNLPTALRRLTVVGAVAASAFSISQLIRTARASVAAPAPASEEEPAVDPE